MSQLNTPHIRNLSGWACRALAFRREGPGFESLSCQCRKCDGARLTHQWLIRSLITAWVVLYSIALHMCFAVRRTVFHRIHSIFHRIHSIFRLFCIYHPRPVVASTSHIFVHILQSSTIQSPKEGKMPIWGPVMSPNANSFTREFQASLLIFLDRCPKMGLV